ncbi:MAG: non-ribosomal peptide synthetase, partial [Spirochaetales bacterium]|nr:non-ribosomal peptide synthetase [Spirochaetales bacterium]
EETVQKLKKLAQNCSVGLHSLFLAILASETRRRTGLNDVIIGNGVSTRPGGNDQLVGHFVNLLPVILRQKEKNTFLEEVKSAQASLTETIEYSNFPTALLFREFRKQHPELRAGRTSLFDIALTANPVKVSYDKQKDFSFQALSFPEEEEFPSSGLDLLFSHEPCLVSKLDQGKSRFIENGIDLKLTWNPDTCTRERAQSWISDFAAWARLIAKKTELLNHPLPALLPHEKNQLQQWEKGTKELRAKKLCHKVFEEFANQHLNHPAVVSNEKIESFGQLNIRAEKIATQLRKQGLQKGNIVGVLASVSLDLPAVLLGIWKAGGTYLPLAKELPAVRLANMCNDAGCQLLLVLDKNEVPPELAHASPKILSFEECMQSAPLSTNDTYVSDESIAYIIYTSGTTGKPKGVPVSHRSFLNTVFGVAENIGLQTNDRMSMAASVGFDASLWELGLTLLTGTALVPVVHTLRDDPWQLKQFYGKIGVTVAFHTPSFLRISEQVPFEGLRILLTGAEAPNRSDVMHYAGKLAFWNCYGPTEAAIVSSLTRLYLSSDETKPLSAGRPLPNVCISIRNEAGTRVPPGFQGEIWIGGDGVSKGYLNSPELSAERFVELPEGRFYRSGDYGRWNNKGEIIITGRIDDQVKLNGQRVELGEIETALSSHPDVAEAIVAIDQPDQNRKVVRAFVRTKETQQHKKLTEDSLAAYLALRLPEHMLPASTTFVASIPLSANGKADRKALLAQARELINTESDVNAQPQGNFERQVAEVWSRVLGCSVLRNDNFFALGGNSLQAVVLAHKISEQLNIQLTPRNLFAAPVFAAFVE